MSRVPVVFGAWRARTPSTRFMKFWGLATVSLLVLGSFTFAEVSAHESRALAATTPTTIAPERPQPGWAVASSSTRGVMVDYKMVDLSGVLFRAIRLRARTTILRWHVGSQDPPTRTGEVPNDARPSVNWSNEGMAGVVAVFNGAFKVTAKAGGSMVDGLTLSPMLPNKMTLALSASGHWKMGMWAPGFPGAHFHAIAYRQNLLPMIANGQLTKVALSSNQFIWGDPLNERPLEPRSALGIDVRGNLIYVATMSHVAPAAIARALLSVGAVEGMELDINPFWPVVGASFGVLHAPGNYPVQLPYSQHNPSVFNTGWERDFFVGIAQPDSWNCSWASAGLGPLTATAQPQPLRETCSFSHVASTTR